MATQNHPNQDRYANKSDMRPPYSKETDYEMIDEKKKQGDVNAGSYSDKTASSQPERPISSGIKAESIEDAGSEDENETNETLEKNQGSKQRSFNPGRFDNDPERARQAGRKGGENPNNPGRFDNNPERAREAGRKGGSVGSTRRNKIKKDDTSDTAI